MDWLSEQLPFPLHVVDNGRGLRDDVRALTNHSDSPNYVDIPVYLKGRDGQSDGIGRRQCTTNYKIRPITRKIRELVGLRPRQRVPAGTVVELWLGISTDEFSRTRPARERWMRNRYPLIEAGMSRRDCLAWWSARYDRPLERSASVACPYQSRRRWVETMRRWPELFAEAVEIDASMRRRLPFAKGPYLHPRRIPLAEAVRIDDAELGTQTDRGRLRQRVRGTLRGVKLWSRTTPCETYATMCRLHFVTRILKGPSRVRWHARPGLPLTYRYLFMAVVPVWDGIHN